MRFRNIRPKAAAIFAALSASLATSGGASPQDHGKPSTQESITYALYRQHQGRTAGIPRRSQAKRRKALRTAYPHGY